MKVITHDDFHQVYTGDPAAAEGRIKVILDVIENEHTLIEAEPAAKEAITAVHTERHIRGVLRRGLYDISALAAGATIQAAEAGLSEPCFALVRPPGHHASADSSWGFCYFNNMAIALEHLRRTSRIRTAYLLDFDLHYGDGNVNILEDKGYVTIHNPISQDRKTYIEKVQESLASAQVDIIGVSAGFDNHLRDWGGLLHTEDYEKMGALVRATALKLGCGCFAVLEGGYNHRVLGENVQAFLKGLEAE
jgi:acetoin utilization deacetylase AcuC-like enzyme